MSLFAKIGVFVTGSFLGFLIFIVPFLAWITHVVVCIKSASWALLIIGALIFPIAVVHGFGVWLGLF